MTVERKSGKWNCVEIRVDCIVRLSGTLLASDDQSGLSLPRYVQLYTVFVYFQSEREKSTKFLRGCHLNFQQTKSPKLVTGSEKCYNSFL
jgi:hypothetical protein